jgi:uncharacterized membrane protein YphA (DoxX/SURF4 family)
MNTTAPNLPSAIFGHPAFGLTARILLTLPYWWSGIAKALAFDGAVAEARHFGLEPAAAVAALTILVQLGGSALIILNRLSWLGAGALAVFTALATLIAHAFWTLDDPGARQRDMNIFLEHIGLIGGLLLAAALPSSRTP